MTEWEHSSTHTLRHTQLVKGGEINIGTVMENVMVCMPRAIWLEEDMARGANLRHQPAAPRHTGAQLFKEPWMPTRHVAIVSSKCLHCVLHTDTA